MRKICCLVAVLIAVCARSQSPAMFIDSILNNRIFKIDEYIPVAMSSETIVFKMDFGKSTITDTTGMYKLQHAQLLSIDLVFTDYPNYLDLHNLNKSRFLALAAYLPKAISDTLIRWQIIRQMKGKDKESAKGMLHGFVINYRTETTREEETELTYIRSITPPKTDTTELEPKEKVRHWDVIHNMRNKYARTFNNRDIKRMSRSKNDMYWNMGKKDSIAAIPLKEAVKQGLIPVTEREVITDKDSLFLLLYPPPGPPPVRDPPVYKKDSTVINAFTRNHFEDMLVIADVTGSMSPYSAQVIQWLTSATNNNNLRYLVCFNDGDKKAEAQKEVGSTGGIYGEPYKDANQVGELIQSTMKKGNGGDLQENVCEAIIKGIAMATDYKDVVLIGDSWAPARDITLASQITKPVKVIVCGSILGPHPDYVTIALLSKGSLHFINEDVIDLTPLREHKMLTIKSRQYLFKGDRVIEVLQ